MATAKLIPLSNPNSRGDALWEMILLDDHAMERELRNRGMVSETGIPPKQWREWGWTLIEEEVLGAPGAPGAPKLTLLDKDGPHIPLPTRSHPRHRYEALGFTPLPWGEHTGG